LPYVTPVRFLAHYAFALSSSTCRPTALPINPPTICISYLTLSLLTVNRDHPRRPVQHHRPALRPRHQIRRRVPSILGRTPRHLCCARLGTRPSTPRFAGFEMVPGCSKAATVCWARREGWCEEAAQCVPRRAVPRELGWRRRRREGDDEAGE
jgi:hypothetical protein